MNHPIIIQNIKYPLSAFKNLIIDHLEIDPQPSILVTSKPENGLSHFLKIITGIIIPDEGQVLLYDTNMRLCSDNACKIVKSKVSYTFQNGILISNLTIRENLLLPINYHLSHLNSEEKNNLVDEFLGKMGCSFSLHLRPSELTYMQRKTISIMRAFIIKPDLVIMDEPLQSIQDEYYNRIYKLIENHLSEGKKCIIGTKDRDQYPFIKSKLSLDSYISLSSSKSEICR